jgi:hypothetical protein
MEDAHILADEQLKSEATMYLCNQAYSERVEEIMANSKVEYLDAFEEVKADVLAEILESKPDATEEPAAEAEEAKNASEETVVA